MKSFSTLFLLALLAGCASVSERAAHHAWEQERAQWSPDSPPGNGLVDIIPAPGPDATLDDYVRYALVNNAGLRAASARWKATLETVAPARALADPRFTYGHFLRQVETRVGPQEHRFSLAQTFPWVGELTLKGKIALQDAEAERQRYAAARDRLVHQVKKTYYELYYLDRATEITRDNARLLSHLEEVARTGYRAGAASHGAVIKAQIEQGRLEDRLLSLRDRRRPLVAQFNAILSRPPETPVVVDTAITAGAPQPADRTMTELLRARSPELLLLDARIAREELAVELAGKERFPDLTVGLDYVATGAARAGSMAPPPDSSKDPVAAMVSVNLPIWRDKYRSRERAARSRQQAAQRQRREKENQLTAALELALFNRRDSERRVALYRDSLIPKAEQALGVTQQAFVAGESDFLALIDAQRVLLEFQLAHTRAVTDRAISIAEISMLIAEQPPAADHQDP